MKENKGLLTIQKERSFEFFYLLQSYEVSYLRLFCLVVMHLQMFIFFFNDAVI